MSNRYRSRSSTASTNYGRTHWRTKLHPVCAGMRQYRLARLSNRLYRMVGLWTDPCGRLPEHVHLPANPCFGLPEYVHLSADPLARLSKFSHLSTDECSRMPEYAYLPTDQCFRMPSFTYLSADPCLRLPEHGHLSADSCFGLPEYDHLPTNTGPGRTCASRRFGCWTDGCSLLHSASYDLWQHCLAQLPHYRWTHGCAELHPTSDNLRQHCMARLPGSTYPPDRLHLSAVYGRPGGDLTGLLRINLQT